MALEQAFVDDCPYAPSALLIDEILEIDVAGGLVRCAMPTHAELPLTRDQRTHPVRHPRHVAGGLLVHMTGMIGFAHAYYVLGLRHSAGWIGYGAKIHSARFLALAEMGPRLVLECKTTQLRRGESRIFARYSLRFTQNDKPVYEGDQVAMWMRIDDGAPSASVRD